MKQARSITQLLLVAALAVGLNVSSLAALAKGGADDPAGDTGGSSSSSDSGSKSGSSSSSKKSTTSGKSTTAPATTSINRGPGSINSDRNLQNEVRGQEAEVRGQEAEARGRANEQETGIRNEIQNEVRNQGEVEIQSGNGARVRLQTEDALAHRSVVATAVLGLLSASSRESEIGDDRGLGDQIRVIAQAQNDSRKKIAESLNKIETKNGVARFILGPDFKKINEVKQEIKANDERIKKLEQIEKDVLAPDVKTQIEQNRQLLKNENARLQVEIEKAEGAGSLLGWLMKLFVK